MAEEEKGFSQNGKRAERKKALKTKTGLVIYKGYGDYYYVNFPDGSERIDANAKQIRDYFYYLEKYDGDIDKAYEKVWEK